jgi:hypothetical protein
MPCPASLDKRGTFVIKKYRTIMEFCYRSENIRKIERSEKWRTKEFSFSDGVEMAYLW